MKYFIIIATVLYLSNSIQMISDSKNQVIIASVMKGYETDFTFNKVVTE